MIKQKKAEITLKNGNYEDFSVSYYLLEDSGKDLYGVAVEKMDDVKDMIEVEEIPIISKSKQKVLGVLELLAKYEVTPVSVVEIIDEIIELEEKKSD